MDTENKQNTNINIEKKEKKQEKTHNSSDFINTNKDELIILKEKLLNNKKKIHDIQLRHLAYIENIKKDAEIKIKNIKNTKKEEFFKKIIPIIHTLEDALFFSNKLKLEKDSLIQGIQLILESLLKTMCNFGVKIEGKTNEIFNPKIHNVILTENSKKIQPNHVISVKRNGFSFNNIILRKAFVTLSQV